MDEKEIIKKLRLSSKKSKPRELFILSLEKKLYKESRKNDAGIFRNLNLRILLPALALVIISSFVGFAIYNYTQVNSMVVKPELLASPTDGILNLEKSLDTDGSASAYLKKVGGQFLTADEVIPGTFILKFKQDTNINVINEYISSRKAKIVRSIDELQIYTIELEDISINLVEEEKPNYLDFVEQDKSIIVASTNSSSTSVDSEEYWNLKYLNIQPALDRLGARSHNINVAVIDTGVCYEHEALKDYITEGMNILNKDEKPTDINGHGCAVASMLPLISSNIKIVPIKALNDKGIGSISSVTQGIFESTKLNVSVINISSFGKTYSEIQNQVVNFVTDKGIKIVASAGNDASTTNTYPAAYDKVISVGALDSNGKVSWFTNKSKTIDMYAPGSKIKVAHIKGGYYVVSGSSFASVEVAGLLALEKTLCKTDGTINGKWNNCNDEENYIVNTAPKFTSNISKTEYITSDKLEYKVTLEDNEKDTITITLIESPEGATFSNNVVIWDKLIEGNFNFKLSATDGTLSSEQVFSIKVTKPIVSNNPNPGNPQPVYDQSKDPNYKWNNIVFKTPVMSDFFTLSTTEYQQWMISNNYQSMCAANITVTNSTSAFELWFCTDYSNKVIAIQHNIANGENIPVIFQNGDRTQTARSGTTGNFIGWKYLVDLMIARGY